MKNIEIKVNRNTSMVYLENTILGNDGESLQGDIIFSFVNDFVDGQARLEYEIEGQKRYLFLTKDEETYKTPIKSVLTKNGAINMQLVVTEGVSEDEIPIFKSNVFYVYCNDSLNAEIEQPDEYPSWIEVANTKLNSIDEAIAKANNLDINVIKQENGAIVTIINQDGTEESVEIHDGVDGKDGVDGAPGRDGIDGKDGYTPRKGIDYFDGETGPRGEEGPVGPEGPVGKSGVHYGSTAPTDSSVKVWIDTTGEATTTEDKITENVMATIQPQVNDIKDVAERAETIAKGRATGYVFDTLADLELWLQNAENTSKLVLGDNLYIRAVGVPDYWWDGEDKQVLETQKVDLTEYIKNTDYATSSKAGILRPANGLFTSGNSGALLISKASNAQIDAKTDNYYPIVPSNLEYAVKSVVGGHVTLTQAEYDALETKAENTYYYIVEE